MAKITEALNSKKITFSLEVTPKISENELLNLSEEPTFISITWHAKTHLNRDLDIPPVRLAKLLRSNNKNVLLHLTCDLLTRSYLNTLLAKLQEYDIRNLLVMLGEQYDDENSEIKSSEELIKIIRNETRDYFCIGVVGFPDGSDRKFANLKKKVEAGADFVVTQAFFDSMPLKTFIDRCRNSGINVPIIPGLFCFETIRELRGFINLCKIKVADNVLDYINKELTEKSSGIQVTDRLVHSIINESEVYHFHFFTVDKLDKVLTLIKIINI